MSFKLGLEFSASINMGKITQNIFLLYINV